MVNQNLVYYPSVSEIEKNSNTVLVGLEQHVGSAQKWFPWLWSHLSYPPSEIFKYFISIAAPGTTVTNTSINVERQLLNSKLKFCKSVTGTGQMEVNALHKY